MAYFQRFFRYVLDMIAVHRCNLDAMARLKLLGVVDAAKEAGVVRRTIRKWIDDGLGDRHLAAVVYGGDLYIDPRELGLFLNYRDRLFSEDDHDAGYDDVDDECDEEEYDDA